MEATIRLDVAAEDWPHPIEWTVGGEETDVKELMSILDGGLKEYVGDNGIDWVDGPVKTWYPTPAPQRGETIEIAGHEIGVGDTLTRKSNAGEDEQLVVLSVEQSAGFVYYSEAVGYSFYAEEFAAEDFNGVGYDGEPQLEHQPYEEDE